MKILKTPQIRAIDDYTIENEPISSDDLMERAANLFVNWFRKKYPYYPHTVKIFCGIGNNGGDGLCIARQLYHLQYNVKVYILRFSSKSSVDFQINERRLRRLKKIKIHELHTAELPSFQAHDIIIDALFGSGLSRPIRGFTAEIVQKINRSACEVIALDIPSGLYANKPSDAAIIQATHTVSFGFLKLAFLLPQNGVYVGEWHNLMIGFHPTAIQQQATDFQYVTPNFIEEIIRPKSKFTHKGNNGRALVIGGSFGKIGACVLMAKATLKAGAGLLTVYTPKCGYNILQTAFPEAMTIVDKKKNYISKISLKKKVYNAIAIGPGLGQEQQTQDTLLKFLQKITQPLVLDADALNIIAKNDCLKYVPKNSILTPHPKEFERLVGVSENEFERLSKQIALAKKYGLIVLVKGAHTAIATPSGQCYFNSTGNPKMATAGSGDVLTGIITAFLAQGYTPEHSAILGVFFHGQAGDRAAAAKGSITSSDLIEYLNC